MKTGYFLIICLLCFGHANAQDSIGQGPILKHWMTPEELLRKGEIGKNFVETAPPVDPIRNVAEFDRMQGALIRYPFGIPMLLIKEMALGIKVTTIVATISQKNTVIQQYLANGIDTSHCNFLIAPTDSYWTRDYGPWFESDSANQIGIIDFPYNRPRPNDDEIPKKVATMLGIPWFGMNLTTTGGNYMNDGLHIAASTQLVWEENPGMTHPAIAQKVHAYLGIDTYHVVADPNNTYIDHIDCWAKFLAPDKILIRKVPPSHSRYAAIEAAAAYWAAQTSPYGYPYRVYRVMTGQDQPYTNSIILNNKVLVPFMGSNWDDSAKAVYQAAMPGYTVKGFIGSPSTPWESTDALHCRVMGIADVGLLYIRHIPLSGNQPCENGYSITAEIINCSHQPVIPDSVLIHYKVNTGSFVTISMTGNGSSLFTGIIPQQPAGSVVRYYLSAADQSGRHSEMPFTGVSDPFKFQTIYTKLTFKPDTLWFHEHYEAFYGKLFSIHNNLTTGVSLNTVQMEGYDPPWWVDSLSVPALPFTINPEDSVTAIVKVPIPVEKNPQDYYADSLRITSSAGEQYLPIRINPDILNSADQTVPGAEIRANYPNPFMVETIIPYYSPRNGKVILEVYDIRGTLVRILVNGYITAGLHKVVWDGTNDIGRMLPGGIYLCRLSTGNTIDTRRMVFIR